MNIVFTGAPLEFIREEIYNGLPSPPVLRMGDELEVIGPHVAPPVAEDVVLRLGRVGRRLPHDSGSRERPRHLRRRWLSPEGALLGLSSSPPET